MLHRVYLSISSSAYLALPACFLLHRPAALCQPIAMANPKNMILDEEGHGSPPSYDHRDGYIKPQSRLLHDPDVTFEEYHYYALMTREEEKQYEPPKTSWKNLLLRKNQAHDAGNPHTDVNFASHEKRMQISDQEWRMASKAFRTAGWGACTNSSFPTSPSPLIL